MRRRIEATLLLLVRRDITTLEVDAITNAANAALAGGGGVDGAIHHAGGPSIAAECRALPFISPGVKCPTGEVRSTTAGALSARWVLHAVGPIYDSRDQAGSAAHLAKTYRSSLAEAARLGARTVAFPSISTGAFRFPLRTAADTAIATVLAFVREHPASFDEITFALFAQKDLEIYSAALDRLA